MIIVQENARQGTIRADRREKEKSLEIIKKEKTMLCTI